MVFNHFVRLQDVGADLAAPADVDIFALQRGDLGVLLAPRQVEQLRLEHVHGHLRVLGQRALVLAGDNHAGRQVGDAHGRLVLLDVLPARAAGPEAVDAQVLLVDLDLDILGHSWGGMLGTAFTAHYPDLVEG